MRPAAPACREWTSGHGFRRNARGRANTHEGGGSQPALSWCLWITGSIRRARFILTEMRRLNGPCLERGDGTAHSENRKGKRSRRKLTMKSIPIRHALTLHYTLTPGPRAPCVISIQSMLEKLAAWRKGGTCDSFDLADRCGRGVGERI